jgi:adenylate cyclase
VARTCGEREGPKIAIEQFEHVIRLSPFDPMDFVCLFGIGIAHFVAGRYDEAIAWTQKGLSQPETYWAYRVLVPALVHAGRGEEAKRAATILMESFPGLTISKVRRALVYGLRRWIASSKDFVRLDFRSKG